jgi:phasin family protein
MQALAQKQTEILNEAMQDSVKAMSTTSAPPDPTRQSQLVQQAFQKALTDMTTIAEMTRKSQVDAMNIIAKRAAESLEEIKKMMQPKL